MYQHKIAVAEYAVDGGSWTMKVWQNRIIRENLLSYDILVESREGMSCKVTFHSSQYPHTLPKHLRVIVELPQGSNLSLRILKFGIQPISQGPQYAQVVVQDEQWTPNSPGQVCGMCGEQGAVSDLWVDVRTNEEYPATHHLKCILALERFTIPQWDGYASNTTFSNTQSDEQGSHGGGRASIGRRLSPLKSRVKAKVKAKGKAKAQGKGKAKGSPARKTSTRPRGTLR